MVVVVVLGGDGEKLVTGELAVEVDIELKVESVEEANRSDDV